MGWIITVFVIILLMDLEPMLRKGSAKGLVVFLLIYLPALTLMILWQLKIPVPSVLLMLGSAMKSVGLNY